MAVEALKIKDKIQKYLGATVMDIGCGDECIVDYAYGVDGRDFPCVTWTTDNLYDKMPKLDSYFDTVFSSHCLEHLPDAYRCIDVWGRFCKRDGYFILYLPDGDYYNNEENVEHFHDTKYAPFMMWFRRAFCGEAKNFKGEQYAPPMFELIESGQDVEKENHYSFFLVAKKL